MAVYDVDWRHAAAGSFDKYVVSARKRGTAEVDAEFLKETEKWRPPPRCAAIRTPLGAVV